MFSRVLTEDELNPPSAVPEGRLIDPSGPRTWIEGVLIEGGQVSSEPLGDNLGVRLYSGQQATAVLALNRHANDQAVPRRRSLLEQIEQSRDRDHELLLRARRRGYRGPQRHLMARQSTSAS
jgi:hypothetical protein